MSLLLATSQVGLIVLLTLQTTVQATPPVAQCTGLYKKLRKIMKLVKSFNMIKSHICTAEPKE